MNKYSLSLILLFAIIPLFAQTEGYNNNGTTYTTTLQHTPYSQEKARVVQVTERPIVEVRPSNTATFECDLELSGSIKGCRIYFNNVSTQRLPEGGINFDASLGARISNSSFLGVGVGVHSDFVNGELKENHSGIIYHMPVYGQDWRLPIYAKARLYMPGGTVLPYWEIVVGGYVRLHEFMTVDCSELPESEKIITHSNAKGGFYFQTGFGIEYKHLLASLGYRLYSNPIDGEANYGYLSVGVRIGK